MSTLSDLTAKFKQRRFSLTDKADRRKNDDSSFIEGGRRAGES